MNDTKLTKGDAAPDVEFDTPWKAKNFLHKACGNNPGVLIFLRYQGCPVCRMEMARLKSRIGLFEKKHAKVFVFLQSRPETVANLSAEDDWPFTIVCDPDGDIFRTYGVAPGGIFKYLHPAGLVAAIKATVLGFRHGKFEGHETQLPAVFITDAEQTIQFAYYGNTISDVPDPEEIADKIQEN